MGPGTVSGGLYGIDALNYGSGGLTITTTGAVTGAASNPYSVGIFALNGYGGVYPGGDLSVSTGPGTVSGAYVGIQASNFGSQALKITTSGDVIGTNKAGIYALNGNDTVHPGTYLSITTGPGTISGGLAGIEALELRERRANDHDQWRCHRNRRHFDRHLCARRQWHIDCCE